MIATAVTKSFNEAADRRQQRLSPRRELALAKLSLDLEPDDKEEDRHPQLVDPHDERLREHEPVAADAQFARKVEERLVHASPGGVAECQREQRRHGEHDAAGRFVREKTGERRALIDRHGAECSST
jgi:hypothetical protein